MKDRPTGITRTAPLTPAAYRRMVRGLQALNTDDSLFFFGTAQKPRHDVLHFYIITGNRIVGRCNIAEWTQTPPEDMEPIDDELPTECKWWVTLTAPFERPPERITMRGHQGIRYVYEPLW